MNKQCRPHSPKAGAAGPILPGANLALVIFHAHVGLVEAIGATLHGCVPAAVPTPSPAQPLNTVPTSAQPWVATWTIFDTRPPSGMSPPSRRSTRPPATVREAEPLTDRRNAEPYETHEPVENGPRTCHDAAI
ncbi:hypothetical protein Pth03_11500 [Planotetraspora thailandica]|uniref:Uncharacterized protein n=1 Tax=Planotetraspora thailandica TaxID=487172 RepID=A0A8J3XUK8_9ACTN|nr:hypothetical protein Pth03_11500 [Planotetraspora thailandica]